MLSRRAARHARRDGSLRRQLWTAVPLSAIVATAFTFCINRHQQGITVSQQTEQEAAFISFRCVSCGQEIEAHADMADTASECPACGNPIRVPDASEDGTLWGRPESDREPYDAAQTEAMKSRTIRIELSDDF